LRFYGQVAYDDDSLDGGGYRGLALDYAEGDRMARILGEKRILFLANHGVVVVGPDVASAFDDLYYLERAAEAQVLAQSTGGRLRMVGDNLARVTQSQIAADQPVYAKHHFDALMRILDRESPEYRR
jgi:ribulose-5-phosphate 4-epimerase/fuculose-1-phosphate aldolase